MQTLVSSGCANVDNRGSDICDTKIEWPTLIHDKTTVIQMIIMQLVDS